MKFIFYLTAITFFSSLTYADDTNEQINKACLRHAISLVTQLKAEVIDDMSQEQSDQTLKIATESCQAYLNKELSQDPEAISDTKNSNEESDDKGVKDWLTEKILNDDTSRKAGNERLMKKR
jgi:hypothetical protein